MTIALRKSGKVKKEIIHNRLGDDNNDRGQAPTNKRSRRLVIH